MDKQSKKIQEDEILMSLENAISAYKTNSFEKIAKKSLAANGKVKRPKVVGKVTSKKGMKFFEEKYAEAPVIKNKVKSKKVKSARKQKGYFKKIGAGIGNMRSGVGNFTSKYSKQLLTVSLCLIMLSFVSYSAYTAYAYMSGVNDDVLQKVGRHIVLPVTEVPKVYIVQSDKSEIFQNPLFAGIALGDNVISYPVAGKVIIYRSNDDKIVNVVNTSQ